MQANTQNSLSGARLPGYSLLYNQIVECNERNRIWTLEEFGWQLGAYALRKADADVVMGFLGDLARAVGTEKLTLGFDKEAKIPVVWLEGSNFPNVGVYTKLGLGENNVSSVASSSGAESKTIWMNLSEYDGNNEIYQGWKTALSSLVGKVNGSDRLAKIHDGEVQPGSADYLGRRINGNQSLFFANALCYRPKQGYK
jgi:hypothetical protein